MLKADQQPIRILHVLRRMNVGGVETWLLNVLRHLDRGEFEIDIMVHEESDSGTYDEDAQRLGAKIHHCPYPSTPWVYARQFKRILREQGPYDIIHSHLALSGYLLLLAHQAGVPVRIAHTHSDERTRLTTSRLSRRLAISMSNRWIAAHATLGLACSRQAALGRFGQTWEFDQRWRIFFSGVDLTPFQTKVDPVQVRNELNIPEDALVIGHVGSLREVKNHHFMLDLAREMVRRGQKIRLLLVGDGPLRPSLEQEVSQTDLTGSVIFTGLRMDVARLMLGAMDVFLFPSLYEANPMALVEAQAAGLPCIVSDHIPAESEVIPPLVRRFSLSDPTAVWAQAAMTSRKAIPEAALEIVASSSFNLETNLAALQDTYRDCLRP